MFPVLVIALAAGLCFYGVAHLAPQQAIASPAPLVQQAAAPVDNRPVVSLPIVQEFSPNQDDRPVGTAIDTLIIHDTETPGVTRAQTIANYFLNPHSEVSAHYIIGKQGEIIQCVLDDKRAWHAGPSSFLGREKVNNFSIGIELVNAQTGTDPFTDAQYKSLIALTSDLMSRYPITLDHITGHRNITFYPKIKKDPANNFDWKRYLDGVQKLHSTFAVQRQILTPQEAKADWTKLGKS